jgi:hypothetical protein
VLRDARSLCSDGGRYIDYGVRLYTVAADPSGDEVLPGRPRVVALREPTTFGGIWDCRLMRWHDETANPVVWYASEEQTRLILHRPELPDKLLCRGAEGSGKTRGVVAPWMLARAILDFAGQNVELGGTAPTMRRLETLRMAIFEKAPPDWYTWRQRDGLMRLPIGVDIRLLSTHRTSEAEGSPVQGYDWAGWAGDELQDQLDAMDDIYARGRRAPGGHYRQCASSSVKDTALYRAFVEKLRASSLWAVIALPGFSNPFVPPEHWENLRQTLDARAYKRRVLAENVGAERATYPDFAVEENQTPIPATARDVTHFVTGPYESYQRPGAVARMVACHDPGAVRNTTVFLRAFLFPKRVLTWMAVDEFVTERTTQETHAARLRKYLQGKYELELPPDRLDPDVGLEKVVVFRDPHTRGAEHPDEDVERAFRRHGFDIFTPAPAKQVIKRITRIEMMNRLIRSNTGTIRFYCACDGQGNSLVPETLKSFQDQERDELERAEQTKKGEGDITHPAVAVGYGLYPFEREDVYAWTYERVMKGVLSR